MQCFFLLVLFGVAAVNTTCVSFSRCTNHMYVDIYNFCVSITAVCTSAKWNITGVQSLLLRSFFSSPLVYNTFHSWNKTLLKKYYICIYMYVCKTCKFRRQAFQDIVVPIQCTPRLLVGRDDLQTLRHSFNDVSSLAWRNKFQDLHIKFDKIPLNV